MGFKKLTINGDSDPSNMAMGYLKNVARNNWSDSNQLGHIAAPNKVLRPDSLNLTLDQNKHLAPDIGANQAGLLSSLWDLLQNIATSMGSSSGWSITKGVAVGVCMYIFIYIIYTRVRTYIYICHISVSISLNMTTTDSLENIPYLCRFLYIIYIYITIAQPVSYLFYFIPLRTRIMFTTPSDSTSRLENRGVTGLETDMERV